MKTFRNFLFVFLLSLGVFIPKSWALSCETSQALNGPDQCWTKVTLSSLENNLVSTGSALAWDIEAPTTKQGAYQVKLSASSLDNAITAGFAQAPIASGNSAMILVRGFGLVRTTGGVASRDVLVVTTSGNVATFNGLNISSGWGSVASGLPVAIALGTSTTNGTTTRQAYVKVM